MVGRKRVKELKKYLKKRGRSLQKKNIQKDLTAYIGHRLKQISKGRGKISSLRTEVGNILGCLTRKWNLQISKTPKIHALLRRLNAETQQQQKKKAPLISRAELMRNRHWAAETQAAGWLAFCSLQRMGNLPHLEVEEVTRTGTRSDVKVVSVLTKHKTSQHVGTGRLEFSVPACAHVLIGRLLARKSGAMISTEEVASALKEIRGEGFGAHSFRRGGIQDLFDNGVPEDRIRSLTLHTSLKALLDYVHCRKV